MAIKELEQYGSGIGMGYGPREIKDRNYRRNYCYIYSFLNNDYVYLPTIPEEITEAISTSIEEFTTWKK